MEDLRALSDAQLARDRMERRRLELIPLLRATMGSFAASLAERRLTWRVENHAPAATVIGDRVRLAQVIGNVMDNAIRHATPGTVITAEVAPAPVDDGAVRVAVTDVGDTVAADALPYLFERFFRVDPSRGRGKGGAGIGLAIVRELVDAHGGSVGAASDEHGVTIWFELPLAPSEPAEAVARRVGAGVRTGALTGARTHGPGVSAR